MRSLRSFPDMYPDRGCRLEPVCATHNKHIEACLVGSIAMYCIVWCDSHETPSAAAPSIQTTVRCPRCVPFCFFFCLFVFFLSGTLKPILRLDAWPLGWLWALDVGVPYVPVV